MQALRVIPVTLALLLATAVLANEPVRNMSVELRVQEDADPVAPGVVRSQGSPSGDGVVQKVYVVNGERAHFEWGVSMPVQWVKSAQTQSLSQSSAAGATLTGQASGVENAVTWLDARQALTVRVLWPGGKHAAKLTVEVETAAQEDRPGQNLPGVSKSRIASTVLAPLGEWSTIAISGAGSSPEKTGVYSTKPEDSATRKRVQLRVLAP